MQTLAVLLLVAGGEALVVSTQLRAPTTPVRPRATGPVCELLRARTQEERRKLKTETGTNWKPRTTPKIWDQDGYFFFQGPTPKTSVQADLPSFFSGDNFAELEIKPVQAIITATGLAAFAVVASVLLGTTIDLPAAAPPAPPAAKVAPVPKPAAKKE